MSCTPQDGASDSAIQAWQAAGAARSVTFIRSTPQNGADQHATLPPEDGLFARVAELLTDGPPAIGARAPRDPRNAQELRLLRHRAAAATSLLAVLVFGASWVFGGLTTAWFFTLAALVFGSIALFGWMFRTGLNLRFRDPSLTIAQMTAATSVTLIAMYAASSGRGVFVLLLLMAFLFGVFKLCTRAMMRYAAAVLVAYGVVILLLGLTRPEALDLSVDLLSWTALAMTLPWFALMASYIANLRGTIDEIDGEQMRMVQALRTSMNDFEEAQRIAQVGSWVVEPSTGRREWTPQTYHMFGLDPAQAPPDNDSLLQLVHAHDRIRYASVVQASLRDLKPFELEFRITPPQGELRWVHARGVPVIGAQGRPVLMRGTLVDITARKSHEEALTAAHREVAVARATLVDAIESLHDGFALFDEHDTLVLCNKAYASMFTDFSESQRLIGMTFESLVRSSLDKGEVIERSLEGETEAWIRRRIHRHRNPTDQPHELQLGDGRWIQVLERRTSHGGMVGVRRDITERKLAEQRQAMQHAIAATIAEHDSLEGALPRIIQAVCLTVGFECGAFWKVDADTGLLRCAETWSRDNSRAQGFLEHSRRQLFAPESVGLIRRACINADGVWISDIGAAQGFQRAPMATAAGLHSAFAFPVTVAESPCGVLEFYACQRRGPDEALLGIARSAGLQIGQFIARIEAQSRVHTLAHFDALTGLPNRSLLQQLLEGAIQQAHTHQRGVSLLFIDLDGFKEVNDRHGHDGGDHLLACFAGRLRESLRASDTVGRGTPSAARVGGDEFIVLIEHVSTPPVLEAVAARVLGTVSQPFDIGGELVTISASIGISMYPSHGTDAESLVRSADRAMYAAKKAGKNRVVFAGRSPAQVRAPAPIACARALHPS